MSAGAVSRRGWLRSAGTLVGFAGFLVLRDGQVAAAEVTSDRVLRCCYGRSGG